MKKINASDIFNNDGVIKEMADDVKTLRTEIDKLRTQASRLKKEVDNLRGATEKENEELDQAARETRKLTTEYRKHKDAISETAIQIEDLRSRTKEKNRVTRLTVKLNKSAEGSYDRLSAMYSLLKIKINQLSAEERKNTKEGKAMVERSKEIYDQMKLLQAETGKTSLNVGNYSEILDGLQGPAANAVESGKGIIDMLKGIARNPATAVISGVAGGVALLGKAFSRTERGARMMSKAQALLNSLWDEAALFADTLADRASKMWDDPQQGIKDYAESFNKGIISRLQGVGNLAQAQGRKLAGFFTDNAELSKQASQDIVTSMGQIITGLSAIEQAAKMEEITERMDESLQIEELRFQITRTNQELTKQAEELATQEAVARAMADDSTLSLRKQIEASEDLIRVGERRAAVELQIAENTLSVVRRDIALAKSRGLAAEELRVEEVNAIVAVEQAERELLTFRIEAGEKRRVITRDLFERELDFAVDLFDSQNMALQAQARNTEATLVERSAALTRLIELDRQAFAEQIKLVEDFTGERVKLNELALIDDERIVRERLRQLDIDDIAMGRILEVLRDRTAATQDLLELEQELTRIRTEDAEELDKVLLGGFKEQAEQLDFLDDTVKRIAERNINQGGPDTGLFARLGITVDDEEKAALKEAVGFAIGILTEFQQKAVELANQEVNVADRRVESAQRVLEAKQREAELGYAVNLESAEDELELARSQQEKALQLQRKALREQQQIESLQQASSIFTAIAKAFSTITFPLNLAAGGLILGAFAAAKARASKLTKNFRKGMYRLVRGPSHEGGGVYLGEHEGVREYAEGGEAQAVFSRTAVTKYGDILPGVVEAINAGEMERIYEGATEKVVTAGRSPDMGRAEHYLEAIERNTGTSETVDNQGRRIVRYKNVTTVYE